MKKLFLIGCVFFCLLSTKGYSQNLAVEASENGKATIYFVRTPGSGALINFRFFERRSYLGKFQGTGFIRHETDPGQTFFWIKAENLDVIEANLKPNGVYIIEVKPKIGAFYSAIKFKEVDFQDENQMKRIQKILEEGNAMNFSKEELEEDKNGMQGVINSSMRAIDKKRKRMKKVINITPEMDYKSNK